MKVRCIKNEGYESSLEIGKFYEMIPGVSEHQLIRVVDESGEDYLYPEDWFVK